MDQTRFEKIREALREALAKYEEYQKAREAYQNYLRETLRSHGLEHKSEDELKRLAPEIFKDLDKRFHQVLSIWSDFQDLQDKAIEIRLQEDPILALCWEQFKNREDYKSIENLYRALGLESLKWVKSSYLRELIRKTIGFKDRKDLLQGAVGLSAHEAIGSYPPEDLLDNPLEKIFKEIIRKIYAQAQKDLEDTLPEHPRIGGKYQIPGPLPKNIEDHTEPELREDKASNLFPPELWDKLTEKEQELIQRMYDESDKPLLGSERQMKHQLRKKLKKLIQENPQIAQYFSQYF